MRSTDSARTYQHVLDSCLAQRDLLSVALQGSGRLGLSAVSKRLVKEGFWLRPFQCVSRTSTWPDSKGPHQKRLNAKVGMIQGSCVASQKADIAHRLKIINVGHLKFMSLEPVIGHHLQESKSIGLSRSALNSACLLQNCIMALAHAAPQCKLH